MHEPEVECISKGKEHKKYEFGNKVSITVTQHTGVIVGAKRFRNEYDGHTLQGTIDQAEKLLGKRSIKTATVDRGYRGTTKINDDIHPNPEAVQRQDENKVPAEQTEEALQKKSSDRTDDRTFEIGSQTEPQLLQGIGG